MLALRIAFLFLFVAGASFTAPAADKVLSLTQYIDILQQLRQSVVSSADSADAVSIAQSLPADWKVGRAGQVFTVSTSAVAQGLRDYAKQRTPGNLAAVTSQLDLMLSDARGMQSAKTEVSAERDKLDEILSRREFKDLKGESWYDRLKRAAQRWISQLLERVIFSSAFPVVSRIVIWGLLAIAVAVAAFWVIRNYRQKNIYTKFTGSADAVSAKPWRDWQSEAQIAAQEGRWRDAVHLSYWAAISFLEGQGLWRPDLARTPREYLKLLPDGDAHHDTLQQLTGSFEKVWYGTDCATAETFAGAAALLERLGCR